ncbi:hypothetical protein IAR50_001310 [Cryptococcus sp. DSM 104548]
MAPLAYHPLNPLSAKELAQAVDFVRESALADLDSEHRVWFKAVTLKEPPKKVLAPFLDEWHAFLEAGTLHQLEPLPRVAAVTVGVKSSKQCLWYEYFVRLSAGSEPTSLDKKTAVPIHHHVACDPQEMVEAEEALLAHPEFQEVIASLKLPSHVTVVADAWIYGADTTNTEERFITFMCYLRFCEDLDSNHYSAPLPVVPTVLADDFSLVNIVYTPIFGGESTKTIKDLDGPFPWDQFVRNEYRHDLRAELSDKDRPASMPYHVSQPQGASFDIQNRVIEWEKWSFHIGYNFREGIVLNDVRYDGRKLFYRLSVSDMTVPYGDPRAPFHRKQAFDLGDIGAGLTANELALGCDCLGLIHYLDFDHIDYLGKPNSLKGVVCIHEQDDGILWKHTNYRTGHPSVVRSRVLIVQTIITVANYEYIFAWKFDQAAALHLETRATGIMSTVAIMPGESSPYGNVVSPGVLATNHQHLFSVRIDPCIDGPNNTVVQEDSVPMPYNKAAPPKNNMWGVGYTVEKQPLIHAGGYDAAPQVARVFKITNPSSLNPISGRPVSYKLVPMPSQLIMAHPESVAYARAEFGNHHIWLTKYQEDELFSGGHYTNQSRGGAEGIRSWVARQDSVEDTDLVLWHTFGLTHNARVEDFPVMPCETHMFSLKPADFFDKNPANDVPASTQAQKT